MPRNPKRRCTAASNGFTKAEVDAMCQLLATLGRGGDVSVIGRSALVQKVRSKFVKMRMSIVEGRSGIGPGDQVDDEQDLEEAEG